MVGAQQRPRILLRGLGSISALGATRSSVSRAYVEPGCAFSVRTFGAEALPCAALSEASEKLLGEFLAARPRLRGLDRSVALGMYAARLAADEAWHGAVPERLGVVLGSSRGATGLLERSLQNFITGDAPLLPSTSPATTLGNLSSWVAQELGPSALALPELSSTCSSALSALGVGVAFLRSGMADAFVTGGTEAPLTPFTLGQMRALGVHSTSSDPLPCRPCASEPLEKNSMVLGEGAAVLALEAVSRDRTASGLALISGIGFAVEPITSKTSIHKDGLGLQLSMQRALADAGGPPPDLVITHTPGTDQGDRAELRALTQVFGENVPYAISNKWLLGHTLGASGALSIEYATLLLGGLRPLPYPYPTPLTAPPPKVIRRVLVNSIGFGGTAASVVLDGV